MKTTNHEVTPPIIAAIRSPRWSSQVQHSIEGMELTPHIHWLPNSESALEIAQSNHGAVLIVELPASFPSNPQPILDLVLKCCNNAQRCPLFILGDGSIDNYQALLREAGATDVCTSMLEFKSLWSRVVRHLKNSVLDDLTVEQTVEARLPW